MEDQSIISVNKAKQELLLANAVNAMQILYRSVLERKSREFLENSLKNGIKHGKQNSTRARAI